MNINEYKWLWKQTVTLDSQAQGYDCPAACPFSNIRQNEKIITLICMIPVYSHIPLLTVCVYGNLIVLVDTLKNPSCIVRHANSFTSGMPRIGITCVGLAECRGMIFCSAGKMCKELNWQSRWFFGFHTEFLRGKDLRGRGAGIWTGAKIFLWSHVLDVAGDTLHVSSSQLPTN